MAARTTTDPIQWIRLHWNEDLLGDPTKFLAMGSVLRLHQIMVDAMERVLEDHDLSRSAYLMLATIEFSDDRAKLLGRIATDMMLHPTTVTTLTDRLEERGLVERHPHPTDRRATFVSMTPAGASLLAEATEALDEADFGMTGLSKSAAQELVSVLAKVRHAAGDF